MVVRCRKNYPLGLHCLAFGTPKGRGRAKISKSPAMRDSQVSMMIETLLLWVESGILDDPAF